jgi:hypothetical protein
VNNLGLDSKKQKQWWDFVKHNRLLWREQGIEWDMVEEEEEPIVTFSNQLDRVMADLDSQCLALAERGIHHLSDLHIQTFETLAKHLQQCGLSTLSTAIQHLLATPEARARHLLITEFLSQLYRQAANSNRPI